LSLEAGPMVATILVFNDMSCSFQSSLYAGVPCYYPTLLSAIGALFLNE